MLQADRCIDNVTSLKWLINLSCYFKKWLLKLVSVNRRTLIHAIFGFLATKIVLPCLNAIHIYVVYICFKR